MDNINYQSLHCFFWENNRVVAYLRAFYEQSDESIVNIGRVLTLSHGNDLGKDLLKQSLKVIK